MSTLDHRPAPTERPFTDRHAGHELWSDLDLPQWDDFTGARDRFFANLSAAAAAYRGRPRTASDERPDDSESAA